MDVFCERCGTRQPADPPRRGSAFSRMLDTVGLTVPPSPQHEPYLRLCFSCRGYSCPDCWNDALGLCQTCEPLPEPVVAPVVVEAAEAPPVLAEPSYYAVGPYDAAVEGGERQDAWPTETVAEVELATGPKLESEPVIFAEPETATELETEPVVVAEVEPEPVVVAEPEPLLEAEVDSQSESDPVFAAEIEPEPIVLAEPEPFAAAEVEPEPFVVPEATETASEPVTAAHVEPEPFVLAELEPQPVVFVEPDPVLAEPEPVATEPEAVAAELEPVAAEAEPAAAEPEPETVAAEPQPPAEPGTGPTTEPFAPLLPTNPFGPARPTPPPVRPRIEFDVPPLPPAFMLGRDGRAPLPPIKLARPTMDASAASLQTRQCSQCQLPLSARANFCRRCGSSQSASA